jgi:hypothetical protein
MGRFTSPDSYGGRVTNPQTLNLYAYVLNNPLKWVDPTGHFAQDPKPNPQPYDPNCDCYPYDDTVKVVINQKKDEPVKDKQPIGPPGSIGQWIPIYGNGRNAINDFQTGHPYRSAFHTVMALSDVFIVKSLAVSAGRYLLTSAAERAAAKAIVKDALIESSVATENAFVVRGGTNLPQNFVNGSGVTLDANGLLQGVSVNSAPGLTIKELSVGIPNTQIGVTTLSEIRAAGGSVTPSATRLNPNHCIMCGLTPETASELFRPTIRNPHKP